MSRLLTCVHVALRRSLTALAVVSALIPVTTLAVSGATEAVPTPVSAASPAAAPSASEDLAAEPSRPRSAPVRPARSREVSPAEVAPASAAATAVLPVQEAAPVSAEEVPPTTPFAVVAGEHLVLPDAVRGVGFHESSDADALPLEPIGTPTSNLNAGRITLPPSSAPNEYLVLPTRGRANGPTTAVDIRVDHGVPVTAAISGTVEEAGAYRLYGRTNDEMLVIVPDDQPDLRVRVLHVEGLTVAAGDRVEAGATVIAATARQLPFASQIDRYAEQGPHVHIDVYRLDPVEDAGAEHADAQDAEDADAAERG